MFKRQRTSRTFMPIELAAMVSDGYHNVQNIPPHVQTELSYSESLLTIGLPNYGKNFTNSYALNDVQVESLYSAPQYQVDIHAQAKAPETNTEAKRKPDLIITDPENESEPKVDSKAKSRAKPGPKPKPKAKAKAKAKAKTKAKLIPINASARVLRSRSKPELMSTNKGPNDESNHSNESKAERRQNLKLIKGLCHEDIKACQCALPRETTEHDTFISSLNRYAIDAKDPRKKIPVLKPISRPVKQCVYCMQNYDFENLFNHMLTTHWASKLKNGLMCDVCGSIFNDSRLFAHHCIESHGMIYNDCLFCPARFTSRDYLMCHYEKHRLISWVWRCRFCNSISKDLHSLQHHLQYTHFIFASNH